MLSEERLHRVPSRRRGTDRDKHENPNTPIHLTPDRPLRFGLGLEVPVSKVSERKLPVVFPRTLCLVEVVTLSEDTTTSISLLLHPGQIVDVSAVFPSNFQGTFILYLTRY